jgi:hypothetical protein
LVNLRRVAITARADALVRCGVHRAQARDFAPRDSDCSFMMKA